MIVLDCTFRDGGYYTNWNFDLDLVNSYLFSMEKSGINAIEIGFRSPPGKPVGKFARVSDTFIIANLHRPNIEYFGVMINANEMTKKIIKLLFGYEDESPINLVRVAIHFKDIKTGERICKHLKDLGYTITCNLMQAADKSFDEIRCAAKEVESWESVDILYLADSLGGMDHDAVNYAFHAIKEGWKGLIGFHGHNNKGQSLTNTLEAIDIGVDWIDGTILGMGRGPGNTEMEYLLNELNKRNFEFEIENIYRLALNGFNPLKDKYKWGPSLLYYLSAEYNIHPIYIQKMLKDSYSMNDILDVIFFLREKKSNSFNHNLFMEALNA
ncbi:MAG: hypothetical protein ACFFG0_01155 [Candidatus Thorarchaeota archaeon]